MNEIFVSNQQITNRLKTRPPKYMEQIKSAITRYAPDGIYVNKDHEVFKNAWDKYRAKLPIMMQRLPKSSLDNENMDHDCCVLFFHHKNDAVTKQNFEALKNSNSCKIVPVCRFIKEENRLEGAVDVYEDNNWSNEANWYGSDIALLHWFAQRTFNAERYIWFEYDSYCNVDVRDYYKEVWNADFAGYRKATKKDHWYRLFNDDAMPENMRQDMFAVSPFNGIMCSHKFLTTLLDNLYPTNIFCEVRMPMMAKFLGFDLKIMSAKKAERNVFDETPVIGKGMFHPVKIFDPNR